ncbi:MAG: uroporphyrinogen-III C-methyltransferase [Azoarcus sp.]|nr:uroporphyrinogen-III C-methyltransferase [Azoarcus sp.]
MDKQTPALIQPPPADDKEDAAKAASEENRAEQAATPEPEEDVKPAEAGRSSDAPPPSAPPQAAPHSGGSGRAGLVLAVLALIGVGVVGWQLWELRQDSSGMRTEIADRLATADNRAGEARTLAQSARESIESMQGRFGALESKVAETEGQAAALESLYQEFSRSRSERALAEVAQAITIANQQLRLAGNFEAALIALQSAESRLAAPEMGHMQDLRRALLKDIDAVKAHPQVDVSGFAMRLELLFERLRDLPLAYTVEPQGTPPAIDAEPVDPTPAGASDFEVWWRNALGFARELGADAWNEMRGMIRLERMDQADPALLAPSQGDFLRENVKLRVLTARLALLAGDARTYAADLEAARELVSRFFDPRDARVQHVLAEFEDLGAVDLQAETPSLTGTFSALSMARERLSAGSASDAAGSER